MWWPCGCPWWSTSGSGRTGWRRSNRPRADLATRLPVSPHPAGMPGKSSAANNMSRQSLADRPPGSRVPRPMKRVALPLFTLVLFAIVVADRLSHAFNSGASEPVVQGPGDTRPATVQLDSTRTSAARPASGADRQAALTPSTPTIDRLARLAARQQLSRMAGLTYLDSLIISTDSVIRRWPDRNGAPLRVAIIEGGPATYQSRMAGYLMEALGR